MPKSSIKIVPPQVLPAPERCLCCGYNLSGLSLPVTCPECGAKAGASLLVLKIVIHKLGRGQSWKRWVWIIIGATAYFSMTFLGLFVFINPWVTLGIPTVLVMATIVMLLISPRDRKGSAWLIAGTSGVGIVRDPNQAAMDDIFWPQSTLYHINIERLGPTWCQLQILDLKQDDFGQPTPGKKIFVGGAWIDREQESMIQARLSEAIAVPTRVPVFNTNPV